MHSCKINKVLNVIVGFFSKLSCFIRLYYNNLKCCNSIEFIMIFIDVHCPKHKTLPTNCTYLTISDCSAYGSTFGTFTGFYIRSFNNVNKGITSIQNCRLACISITTFVCRTFEIVKSKCHLSSQTALSKPSYYMVRDDYTLWQRSCA